MKALYPFQLDGAAFLTSGNLLLADEPGAGKTLQAIEACKRLGAERVLVICPAVALGVWRDEVQDQWPEVTPIYLRDAIAANQNGLLYTYANGSLCVGITSYDYMVKNAEARLVIDQIGRKGGFDVLILDEAHALKNPYAQRTLLIYGPQCSRHGGIAALTRRVMLLTGTPQLNHPGEWWTHLRALAPERLVMKSYQDFTDRYCTTKIRTITTSVGQRKQIQVLDGANRVNLPELRNQLRGFWLRRKIADQLPPLRVVMRSIPAELCDTHILAKVGETSQEVALLEEALKEGHEALHAIEIHVARLRRLLSMAKVGATIAWVEDLLDQGVPKVVVFGLHVEALRSITQGLGRHRALLIMGETPTTQRARIVERFQTESDRRVFVGQIQAAGTAITLTAANRVVMHEMAWTPALNLQAIKRCHRIGTAHPVLAEVLAVEDSIDYAVAEILARKSTDIELLEESA